MRKMKTLSAVLACVMALSLFAGCSSKEEDSGSVVPNVITAAGDSAGGDGSGGGDGGAVTGTTAPPEPGAIVTDDNGEAVTGVGGNVLTEPVATWTEPSETLSEDDIAAAATAQVTQATTVMHNDVDSTVKYAYNTLSKDEKQLYDAIVESATKLTSKIRVSDAVTTEIWTKIFGMVYNQEPQLFWLNNKIKVGRIYFNETDPDRIKSMQKEIDTTVDKLISEASGKSTYDKLKIFHDHLVYNSTFQKTDEIGSYNESVYNAFRSGTSAQGNIQCAGYAKSMLYLCDKAGIGCMVITGTNESGSTHAWNKVKVDGEWYNLDCTWDDPILSTPDYQYLRYTFFLVPDSWIENKTHFNVNLKKFNSGAKLTYFDPPAATATAQNYFVKNGYVYNDVDSADAAIKKAMDDTIAAGKRVSHIMVGSKSVYDTILSRKGDYETYAKGKSSKIKSFASNSVEGALVIEFDVKYN